MFSSVCLLLKYETSRGTVVHIQCLLLLYYVCIFSLDLQVGDVLRLQYDLGDTTDALITLEAICEGMLYIVC